MIHKLSDNVINQIAAGEVVERPASVLKELIENSLDANSTHISIYVEDSGIKKIQVIDNGTGIEKEDIPKLFVKHTTSKILDINDLHSIQTFGFRGEALATIASVSRVKLQTKHQKDNIGTEISIIFGSEKEIKPSNITIGTNILVEDLFGNVPVRRKFLRTKLTENKANSDVVVKYLLSNPNISFYINMNGTIKNYPREDLITRVSRLFKIQDDKLIEIQYQGLISINGFIIHPQFFSTNKANQYIFINKRPVTDQIISKAIMDGLDSFLMKNQYPSYVLFIEIDPQEVDVNVHPRKIEVRFRNNNLIYSQIKAAIVNTLTNHMRRITQNKILNLIDQIDDKNSNNNTTNLNTSSGFGLIKDSFKTTKKNKEGIPLTNLALEFNQAILNISKKPSLSMTDQDKNEFNNKEKCNSENVNLSDNFSIDTENITQLLNSYIITANPKSIIIIDQHAASEKILYERYIKLIHSRSIESKVLLIPIVIDLDPAEIQIIKKKSKQLNDLGFDFEEFGLSSIKITKVPSFARLENFEKVFKELISEIINFSELNSDNEKIIKKIAASLACHSAVRFGDKLTKIEMIKLINDLMACENPYNCPHGRPIIQEFDINEIEKKFKRCI